MPRFQVVGTGRDTRRKRTRVYEAKTEDGARHQADGDGIDVSEIVELPPEPPTENQIAYAQRLGIAIPLGVTFDELSDLISLQRSRTDQQRRK